MTKRRQKALSESPGIRVLLAEGNRTERQRLRRFLSGHAQTPFQITDAATLQEALGSLREHPVDLVLLRLDLPDSRGLETLAHVLREAPRQGIVVIASGDEETLAIDVVGAGAQDCLARSRLDGRTLRHALRCAWERHRTRELGQNGEEHLQAEIRKRTADMSHIAEKLQEETEERRRAVHALGDIEEENRAILSTVMDGFAVMDAQGRVLRANQACCQVLGYSEDEMQQMSIGEIDVTQSPDDIAHHMQKVRQDGFDRFQTRQRRKDGRIIDVEVSASYLPTTGHFFSFVRDVTERKHAEEGLRESERKFRHVVESSGIGILILRSGEILYCNRKEAELFGYSDPEQILGKPPAQFIHPDDVPPLLDQTKRLLAGEPQAPPVTFRGLRPDGRELVLEGRIFHFPFLGNDCFLVFHVDITERRHTEEALKDSEDRNRSILRTAMDGIWALDTRGKLVLVNEAYCRMSGYSEEELLRMSVADIEAQETPEDVARHVRKVQQEGVDRFETRHRRKDGHLIDLEISLTYLPRPGWIFAFMRDITDRKLAEKALRESEERYRQLFSEFPIGLYRNTPGPGGRLLLANAALARMFGYDTLDDFLKIPVAETYQDPHDRVSFSERLVAEGTVSDVELRLRKRDGTLFWGSCSAHTVRDSHGNVLYFEGSIRDITELKRSNEALLEREAWLWAIYTALPDVIYRVNREGICLDVHYPGPQARHFSEHQVRGKSVYDLDIPLEIKKLVARALERALTTRHLQQIEYTLDTPEGLRHVEARAAPCAHDEVVVVARDVTSRRQAEERLAHLNDCFLEFGPDTPVNISHLVALCGQELTAAFVLYICPEGGKCFAAARWNAPPDLPLETEPGGCLACEVLRADGNGPKVFRHLDQSPFAQSDPMVQRYGLQTCLGRSIALDKDVVGALCVVYREDYTPTDSDLEFLGVVGSAIAVEEARNRMAAQLLRQERLATIGQTVASVAHTMRNVLTVFTGCRHLLKQGIETDRKDLLQQSQGLLDRAATRLDLLVKEMLDYAKPRRGTHEEVRLDAVFGEVARALSVSLQAARIHLETHVEPGGEIAFLDRERLDRSLMNLAFNAIEAMPKGGRLRFAASAQPLGQTSDALHRAMAARHPHLHADSPVLLLEVHDTGAGIPQESIPRLFEPFHSTKGSRGTGLGLLSVRQFVEDHGGVIHVESAPGQGTAIFLCFPHPHP